MYNFIPSFLFGLMICFIVIAQTSKEKAYKNLPNNHGKITKFEHEGHSYIGWTCNMGCSMVHDPECKCRKDNSSPSS